MLKGSKMQKWEYKLYPINWDDFPGLERKFNRLGGKGWEAIWFFGMNVVVFKRSSKEWLSKVASSQEKGTLEK